MKPGGRFRSLSDLYMALLWPRAIGAADDAPIFAAGSPQYRANQPLDVNRDLVITKAEAASFVAARLQKGLLPANFG